MPATGWEYYHRLYLVMGDLELRLKYKKEDGDDWTKVKDRALRKKIQNRLAKRKNRRFFCTDRELIMIN